MITLTTTRPYVQHSAEYFFSYINLYKQTRLNNVAHLDGLSEQYLSAIIINSLLEEVEILIQKKLINTTGDTIKFNFTDAQAVVWYKTLLAIPLRSNQDYLLLIRNDWVARLHKPLLAANLLKKTTVKTGDVITDSDYW